MPIHQLDALSKALASDFQTLVRAHASEQFSSFALYSDDDAWTIVPAANSIEGTQRRARDYQRRGMQLSEAEIRVSTAEWAFEAFDAPDINAAGKYFLQCELKHPSENERQLAIGATWGAMFCALRLAAQTLREIASNQDLHLFCSVSGSDEVIWLEHETSRRLNPKQTHDDAFAIWPDEARKVLARQLAKPSLVQQRFRDFVRRYGEGA